MGDAASAVGVQSEEAAGGGTDVWSADADAGVRFEESAAGGTDVWSADADADADAGVRFEESAAGGTDVWSDASAVGPADHLVVMVHGILGSTADWQYGAKQFVESLGEKIVVHCSERNMYRLTLDGVDVMGERLAEEVLEVVNGKPEVKKISFVAHSVGGLVARYAIGRLYRPIRKLMKEDVACDDNSKGTICGLEPMNFITVATPHLGSRGNNQVPFLFGVTAVEKVASLVVHWIFRRTGRHLFLTDNAGGQPPLLQRMVYDCGDLYFMSALRAFKRRVVYANVGYDHIVGWRTSSIRRNSELPKLDNSSNEKYPHIVHEEHSKGSNVDEGVQISATNDPCEEHSKGSNVDEGVQISATNDPFDMIEEMMVTALSRLSWERVDVSFQSSMQRFAAHSVIQVKFSFMESDGADVIRHMIDHFLT